MKRIFSTQEKSFLASLPAPLLKMPEMTLGLHACAAEEGSCPSVRRCWDHECVAVCSYFCAAMISSEEKSDCKTLHKETEVSVTDQECRWNFGHTEDVVFLGFLFCLEEPSCYK